MCIWGKGGWCAFALHLLMTVEANACYFKMKYISLKISFDLFNNCYTIEIFVWLVSLNI